MANRSRVYLKNVFKQNAVPTEQNFADLIDSYYNPVDDRLHLDNRGLVIGDSYKKDAAPENGLLVEGDTNVGSLQVAAGLSLATGVTVTGIDNNAALGNSSSSIPTQSAVKAYADTKAKLNGDNSASFAAKNLSVNGYLTFDTEPETGSKAKVNDISIDSTFADAADNKLVSQKAIKTALDQKANSNGNIEVDFNANVINANRVETKSLIITQNDYQVINLTINNTLKFGNSSDYPIDKVSIDGTFTDAVDTTLATQKAVKTYADTKANKIGDLATSFAADNLMLNGQLSFNSDTSTIISEISNDGTFADAADTSLPTQTAVKSYVDNTVANLALKGGDSSQNFETADLSINGQLQFGSDAGIIIDHIKSEVSATPSTNALLTEAAIVSYVDNQIASINAGSPSDARLKTQVQNLSGCLTQLMQLQGVSFEWTNPLMPTGKQFGFIAQQVEEVMPEMVHTGDDGYKSVAYLKLIAFLTEAIKEQQGQIDALRQNLAEIATTK